MNKFIDRAEQFGPVGDYLLSVVERFPTVHSYGELSFVDALTRLRAMSNNLHANDALLPAAVSLLCLPFPLQVEMSRADVYALLVKGTSLPFNFVRSTAHLHPLPDDVGRPGSTRYSGRFFARLLNDHSFRRSCFPTKKMLPAEVKPNLALAPLIRSFSTCAGPTLAGHFLRHLAGHVTEDVAMAAMVYAHGLVACYGQKGYDIAAWLVLRPAAAKGISTAIKALGANAHDFGAVLCEAQTLLGRAVSTIDLAHEAEYRCDPDLVAKQVIEPGEELRSHIRAVLAMELAGRDLSLPDLDSWWSSRWLWCVNGSQNDASSRLLGIDTARFREFHTREYRRMASEALTHEPITSWDGYTNISASPKLEHGKTRAIFACDTRSYFAFEWLLGATQKAWRNHRVLLDPGGGGHLGISRRVRSFMKHGGVNLMLDFDDFNSHHSLNSQRMLFGELCDRANAPGWYRKVLSDSWGKMHVNIAGHMRPWLGTLPSGHRGTTIVNSVLNAAYIRMALGGPAFDKLTSLHTGDDVYIRADTLTSCEWILDRVRSVGCRINPAKQSVGFGTGEFLRMAITQRETRGYLARSVASFVSGNWTNQNPLDPADALRTAIVSTRALINRSGRQDYARLVGPALRLSHPLGTRNIIRLLSGDVALDDGPVYNTDGRIVHFRVEGQIEDALPVSERWPHNATDAYLLSHVSEVERAALAATGTDAAALMLASSFSKGHSSLGSARRQVVRVAKRETTRAHGFADASDLLHRDRDKVGVLKAYPLVNLVKNRLRKETISELLILAGHTPGADPYRQAFGEHPESKNIIGSLSHSDASALGKATRSGNIYTLTPVFV
ncbi:RNA dependent RNA polymerase [Sphaeropsis sapinea RNA virus 1]|uniref:RNA-directed RNA polymerase n=1 Tax=Sphaeropsis sapinea RNA virus 1 TaxID=73497 RepID=Q9YXE6_9VIRU|nr:RNA dependent RNA polymerase [Sphaeropsis sapinea RNA virus 1]AAD11601.1 RNA dependent RNA polymerase [Sphaeropsis sapinea RNA virus 1]